MKHSNLLRGLLFSIPLVVCIASINLFIIGTGARAWTEHKAADPVTGASIKREVGLWIVCNFVQLWPHAPITTACQHIDDACSLDNVRQDVNSVRNPLLGNAVITINSIPPLWTDMPYDCTKFKAVRAFAILACIFMCASLPFYVVSMCTNHQKVWNTVAVVLGYVAAFWGMLAMAVFTDLPADPDSTARVEKFYSYQMFVAGWVMTFLGNSLFAFLSFWWDL